MAALCHLERKIPTLINSSRLGFWLFFIFSLSDTVFAVAVDFYPVIHGPEAVFVFHIFLVSFFQIKVYGEDTVTGAADGVVSYFFLNRFIADKTVIL